MSEASPSDNRERRSRGWDAIEIKLKERGLSGGEIEEARKSFYDGIDVLHKMFLVCYDSERKGNKAQKYLV